MEPNAKAAMLIDRDDFFRLALRSLLLEHLSFNEVLEAKDLNDATLVIANNQEPRLMLLHLSSGGVDVFDCIREIRQMFSLTRVVVLSGSRERDLVFKTIEAGAHGYIPKNEGVQTIIAALEHILKGEIFLPKFIAEVSNGEEYKERHEAIVTSKLDERLANITPRQQDVLQFLVRGFSNKEISRALSLSESAIKFHVAALCSKLGVRNRTEIAVVAAHTYSDYTLMQ